MNRLKDSSKTSHSTNQSRVNNHSTIIDSDSYDTIHRPNVTVEVNNSTISRLFYRRNDNGYEIIEGTDRRKRDIRNDILVNELQNVVKIYNSEITTQVKSAVNSIVSQSDGLNGLRNLLTFSFSNLATNGLNDVHYLNFLHNFEIKELIFSSAVWLVSCQSLYKIATICMGLSFPMLSASPK